MTYSQIINADNLNNITLHIYGLRTVYYYFVKNRNMQNNTLYTYIEFIQ